VFQWIWAKGATSFSQRTNLSKDLRADLARKAIISRPKIVKTLVSRDGTVKFLLELADKALIETVLIPEQGHFTQCLSSQVGCSLACAFCSTGRMGFERNLTPGEIAGQVLAAKDYLAGQDEKPALRNLVFMGMGEPLLNLDNVLKSLEILTDPQGLNFSPRRITVSTVGFPEGLKRLGESGPAALAVSLHAPTQELREKIMPKAGKVPLDKLMAALKDYPLKPRQRITIEYILLGGVNDSVEHARDLVRLLSNIKVKINLIAFNKAEGLDFEEPDKDQVLAFEQYLRSKNFTVTLRKSKGRDISAACGQLKAETRAS